MEKISFSHFKLSSELSEARKHIGSIHQYLLDPRIQDELFVNAIEKVKEIQKNKNTIETPDDKDKKESQQKFDAVNSLLLVNESFRLELLGKFRPHLNGLLSALNDTLSSHPIKVNMIQIMMVECWFWFSNIKTKSSLPQIKLIDGRVEVIEAKPDPFNDFIDRRIELIKTDLRRRSYVFMQIASSFLTKDVATANEEAHNLLNGNMNSTDPLFGLYFAFTLSQCSVYDIKEFLNYQNSEFVGDFKEFLEITLLKYRQLFTDEQVIVASSWVAKTEVAPTIPPKGNDSIDYNTIVGLLTDEELVIFFSFFYLETNGEKTPFLPQKDVQALLKNGFSLSSMPKPQFKLELDGSKSAGIIYYCIHSLYDKHGRTRNDKKFIAQFFYDNFTNFSKITFDNFMNAINPTKPKTMTFDLFENGYLKD